MYGSRQKLTTGTNLLERIPAEGRDVKEQLENACIQAVEQLWTEDGDKTDATTDTGETEDTGKTEERWIQGNSDRTGYFKGIATERFPESVLELLKEVSLFYHVPAAYLFPLPDMQEEDSLDFFQVDYNWVIALLDGVCSVGRNASIDYSHDTEMLVKIYDRISEENVKVRPALQGKENLDICGKVPKVISGFLLNSVLVENFRGLEFRAYDEREGGEPLRALRIETLGSRLLLGIFQGEIKRLEIAMPPEGLHFGFLAEGGILKKTIRDIDNGKLREKQAEIVRKPKKERIIDVKASARNLKEKAGLSQMTSAEFALEMIQNAQTGVFQIEKSGERREIPN